MSARLHRFWLLVRGEDRRGRKLRKLLELLRPYRARVVLGLIALVLATGASLVPPYLAGRAIDSGIRAHDERALTLILALFLLAAVLNWIATYGETYLINWVGQRALQDLRIQIFTHLQRLSVGFYSKAKAGVLISRLTNDVQALDQLVTDGIYTLVGERGLTLSGGQRQRVAIARALLSEPRILILDDATSSVDATTESRIKSALREVMEGRTTFVIAHRLSTIALADEIVVLDRGRVVARGTHGELLETSPVYRDIYEHGLLERQFADAVEARAGEEELEAAS